MIATPPHLTTVLRHFQFLRARTSPKTVDMRTMTGMRALALIGVSLLAAPLGHVQDQPSRISWAPSYSGSCTDCSLMGSNMSGWNISKLNYPGADLTAANLQRVHGHHANFKSAQATGADLRLGDFTGAIFEQATLTGARMQHATFNSANMGGALLTGANLSDGKFIGAVLSDAKLQASTVHNADFSAATLSGASLSAADLTGSVFDNAVLQDADLTGANLTDVSFRDVRLSGAKLDGVVGIESANFDGACASEKTQLPVGLILPDCVAF